MDNVKVPVGEQELIDSAKGERVTLEAVNAAIISEHYFTARQGARAATLDEAVETGNAPDAFFLSDDLGLLTICVLRLWNGFTVLGQSACADAVNYNKEIGRRLARADAVNKMWALMGYELKSRIARDQRLLGGALVEPSRGMETYIGTKVINATPMTRLGYNQLRGWKIPANEDPNDEGYLVEYTDRVENPPHVPGFKGYVSWSPKEVFERAYRPVRVARPQAVAASAEGSGPASTQLELDLNKDKLWQEAAMAGRKLDAIREYRAAYQATLAVSKDSVEAYLDALNRKEETWVDRAKVELSELTARYDKLSSFIGSDAFQCLPSIDRRDLYSQVNHMEGYKHVLSRRLARQDAMELIGGKPEADVKVDW